LPISILAESCPAPERFIGIHFFSPVDKMQLVEIIRGEKTSDETAARAYDYVQQIGKIPIIVNDARGFFTSRVFGTYLDEGQALLIDGMNPIAIERAAWKAGMPVGPFAVHDEVSMELSKKVHDTHVALDERFGVAGGFPADGSHTQAVAHQMVEMGRGGRHYGAYS
ncbi:MAG: 3-hydroxyacyl-CoA dehydrogenase family protein, partial [Pseudomonadota bacterium]